VSVRTALLSVSDKSGLVSFARALTEHGVHILSSGGTANALASSGIPVETVEAYTGSPEVMDGRVKTLHPRVHGGILSRGQRDRADLETLGAREIELVVVNLYPFERVASDPASTLEQTIENIDIGGPSMVRPPRRITLASRSCAIRATTTGCSQKSRFEAIRHCRRARS
jgi:phosphoribosylaminoimidazolecarboxamide formyltransferase/IMP cyclohydrolase